MRIGMLADQGLVNSNYRSYQPIAAISRRDRHEIHYNLADKPLPPATLMRCDVVHMHRIATPELIELTRSLREAGVGIVWDNDDDEASIPRSNPRYRSLGGARGVQLRAGIRTMVRLADVVTTPSPVLAEQYKQMGARDVRVLENYLARDVIRVRPARRSHVTIACLAALEHRIDYDGLRLREMLAALLDAHDRLRVLSIGLGLGLASDRYEHIDAVDFRDLIPTLARADIGIAPLVDIPWNRARSNVKLKEYSAAGLAWLASPVGPYLGMDERRGGLLVPDERWYEMLDRLCSDARLRCKLAKRAYRWSAKQGIDRHAGEWERALRDAAERGRERRRGGAA